MISEKIPEADYCCPITYDFMGKDTCPYLHIDHTYCKKFQKDIYLREKCDECVAEEIRIK